MSEFIEAATRAFEESREEADVKPRDLEYLTWAYDRKARSEKVRFRKWNPGVPMWTHAVWASMEFLRETTMFPELKRCGAAAILYHDLLEHTTAPVPSWQPRRVREAVEHMTFKRGIRDEIHQIWYVPLEIRLFKFYTKVANLLDSPWMKEEYRKEYIYHAGRLQKQLRMRYRRYWNIYQYFTKAKNKFFLFDLFRRIDPDYTRLGMDKKPKPFRKIKPPSTDEVIDDPDFDPEGIPF